MLKCQPSLHYILLVQCRPYTYVGFTVVRSQLFAIVSFEYMQHPGSAFCIHCIRHPCLYFMYWYYVLVMGFCMGTYTFK